MALTRGNGDYTNDIKNVKAEYEEKKEIKESDKVVAGKYERKIHTEEKPKDKYDTTSQFMKNGIKEEQEKEEQNDFIDEKTIKEMQENMAGGFGITQEELNQNQNQKKQKNKKEVQEEEPKDEIKEKYKDNANDDAYNPTQKIVNKKALAEF